MANPPKSQPAGPTAPGGSGLFGNVFQGIGSALGGSLGRGIGSAAGGAISRGIGLTPKPAGPTDPRVSGANTNAYLDTVFPGTNPWERLGVNASSPTEIAAEQGRNQVRVANQQAKVALAVNGAQIDAQQKIAQANLMTQETLKRQELATSKDIATTQARANVINGLGIQDPSSVNPALKALMSGDFKAAESFTGQHGIAKRGVAAQEATARAHVQRAASDAQRTMLEVQRLPDEVALIRAKAAAEKLRSSAAMEGAIRSGGVYSPITRLLHGAIETLKNDIGSAKTKNDAVRAFQKMEQKLNLPR